MYTHSIHRYLEQRTPLGIFSAVMSNVLLFFLIFGLSATVQLRQLHRQFTNKFALMTGVIMQFLFMPVLGFVAVSMLKGNPGFTRSMGIILLVVTSSPGGSYSNWWCSLFNADLALSVAMTSCSSILSIGLLPANLFFYTWITYTVIEGEKSMNILQTLDFKAIFISLGVVLSAIISGLYSGYRWDHPKFHKRANFLGSICGITLILFSVFLSSGAGDSKANFWSLPWSFYVGVAFPCVAGMVLANIFARMFRLSYPEVVAISIECCYQNTAIATSVAVTMFSDPTERAQAVSVPLFYGFVEAILIGVYCVWAWKVGWTKAPPNEKLCVVITKTYEVDEDDDDDEKDEGGEEEDQPQHHQLSGLGRWWGILFEPRVKEPHQVKRNDKGEPPKVSPSDRDRFDSADSTIATSTGTPPSTPDMSLMSSTQTAKIEPCDDTYDFGDLEAPALSGQAIIEIIHALTDDSNSVEPTAVEIASQSTDEVHVRSTEQLDALDMVRQGGRGHSHVD